MEVVDFLGMFILWLAVSLWMVFWTYAVPEKAKAAMKKVWIKTVSLGKDDGTGEEAVDVNNDSLVLREVLKQIGELREIQEAKNEGGPLPRDAKSAV